MKQKQKGFARIEFLVVLAVVTTIAAALSFSPTVRVAHATQAVQSSTCLITADVLEVAKERKLILGSEFQPPSPDYYIDYYLIHLSISEISIYKTAPGWMGKCDRAYAQKVERNGAIMSVAEYQKNPIYQGQTVKGYLNFGGDERFHGDFLSGVQVLGKASLPSPTLAPLVSTISPSVQPRPSTPTNFVELILNFIASFLRKLTIWKKTST